METQKHTPEWLPLGRVLMVTLLFMMLGTAMELYLLDHYEDTLQLIPLLCIGLSLLVFIVLFFKKTKSLRLIFQILMGLTALSGILGAYLHFQANYEFEQEMKPTAGTWDLLTESLSGALPTLAPGSMIVLALIGYSYLILLKQKQ